MLPDKETIGKRVTLSRLDFLVTLISKGVVRPKGYFLRRLFLRRALAAREKKAKAAMATRKMPMKI